MHHCLSYSHLLYNLSKFSHQCLKNHDHQTPIPHPAVCNLSTVYNRSLKNSSTPSGPRILCYSSSADTPVSFPPTPTPQLSTPQTLTRSSPPISPTQPSPCSISPLPPTLLHPPSPPVYLLKTISQPNSCTEWYSKQYSFQNPLRQYPSSWYLSRIGLYARSSPRAVFSSIRSSLTRLARYSSHGTTICGQPSCLSMKLRANALPS